jgi:hypothetical protein
MANLRDTETDSLTVGGSAVWTASQSNNSSPITADKIAGYNIEFLDVWGRTKYLGLFGTYSNTTFYPMIISGLSPDSVTEVDLRRTSIHQDGSGRGALFGTFRWRGNGYNFWEVKENWGSGWGSNSRWPFLVDFQVAQNSNDAVIWVRGGQGYYYKFSNWSKFDDTSATVPKNFDGSTVTSTTSTSAIPYYAMYLQQNVCSQGYSLGQSTFRHSTVYTVNAINTSSDRRFKEDIQDLDWGKDFILNLSPKSYTLLPQPHASDEMKEQTDKRRQHGLVAQDVKATMDKVGLTDKDFSGLNNKEDYWGLEYDQFIPICTKVIQEQNTELDDIDARIKKLEEMV